MPTKNAVTKKDRQPRTSEDWVVSKHKHFRANIIVWGMPKDLTTLEIRAKLANLGLASFVRGNVLWEGDHVRLVLTSKDSKGLSKELVSQVSSSLRKIGCRCVLDDDIRGKVRSKPVHVDCVNRFEPLTSQKASSLSSSEPSGSLCSGENIDNMHIDVNLVGNKEKALGGKERERRLRVATWKFSGLGSERKQKEIGELLTKNGIDVVAGQESWEREDTRIEVEGYKWFGKPSSNQNSRRGEGGVGFLVRECLVSEVECITSVEYEESVWMKVRGGRGGSALYVGCVYMPTDSTSVAAVDAGYVRLKEDVLSFRQNRKVVLLGDFNARVGRSVELDDVIGENTCNASGNRLVSFLNEVEMVVCNGRKFLLEPEWTRVRPSLKQKSIIDYIITDPQLMAVSGNVHVDNTDIGCSDHF